MRRTLEGVEPELDNFMKWYWVKWILMLTFKLIIDVPFIICGPIMAIVQWRGLSHYPIEGIFFCCLFSLVIIPDLYFTILVPWFGARSRDFPVWMEDWKSAKGARKHEGLYLTIWRYL